MEPFIGFSIVRNGRLGSFRQRKVAGVSVYTPEIPEDLLPESKKGRVILTSGAGGNHTSFGEIPQQLARNGWDVQCVVYPGYENPNDLTSLSGGGLKGIRLAEMWEQSIQRVLWDLMEDHPGGPLFLGGFSMGAAGTLLTYAKLPPDMKDRVSGLILAAPAVNVRALSSPNPVRNWIARHVVLPTLSFLGLEIKKDQKGVDSDIRDEVEVAMRIPRATNYGSVLLIERGKSAAELLEGDPSLPKVLLVHSGSGDPTVAESSVTFLKEVFGNHVKQEILMPQVEGHYVLVGSHRRAAQEAIARFVNQ